jgi:hypothetical protein
MEQYIPSQQMTATAPATNSDVEAQSEVSRTAIDGIDERLMFRSAKRASRAAFGECEAVVLFVGPPHALDG